MSLRRIYPPAKDGFNLAYRIFLGIIVLVPFCLFFAFGGLKTTFIAIGIVLGLSILGSWLIYFFERLFFAESNK